MALAAVGTQASQPEACQRLAQLRSDGRGRGREQPWVRLTSAALGETGGNLQGRTSENLFLNRLQPLKAQATDRFCAAAMALSFRCIRIEE